MAMARDQWLRSRERARQRQSQPAIDSCRIRPRPEGGYEVIVRGRELAIGGVPTRIRVGGRPVRRVQVTDSTQVRGEIDDARAGDEVVVDVGPAGLLTATIESAP